MLGDVIEFYVDGVKTNVALYTLSMIKDSFFTYLDLKLGHKQDIIVFL